jgi:hypothetical protein
MRALLIFLGIVAGAHGIAGEPLRVEGVKIDGNVHEVSVNDIHDALASLSLGSSKELASLEVVGRSEIHAHLQNEDLGWIPVRLVEVNEPDGHSAMEWHAGALVFWGRPEAMRLVKTAEEVYVFPVATPLSPHRGKQLRLLDAAARKALGHLLGDKTNWLHGFDNRTRVGDEPTNIGFLFRHGSDELVLFFSSGGAVEATLNGENTGGSLEDRASVEMEKWKNQYAKPELVAR